MYVFLKKIFFMFALVFLNANANAFEKSIQAFVSQQEAVTQSFGDPVLSSLYQYRKAVEKDAYQNTLQLCEGYRRARGLGPHPAHGKYMFSAEDAASAWSKVLVEGAKQPLSGMFGLKSDYLEYGQYGMRDWSSWFQSMYTMYLVNSFGFLGGAVHCLGTMDQKEIEKLALAIINVDIAATSVTTAGGLLVSFFIPEILFPKIVQATGFVFRPVTKLLGYLSLRVGRVIPLRIAGITVGGVVADNLMIYMQNKEHYQKELQELINPESAEAKSSARTKRFLQLTKTFEVFYKLYHEEQSLREQSGSQLCYACEDLYKPYNEYLKLHYNKELQLAMQADFDSLSKQYFLSQEETLYFELLKAYLPILNEHVLSLYR
jgi:hypothetical protein